MDQNINKIESKYERLRKIGIGSYGVVFKCVNRATGQIVAIKRYSENDSDPIIRKIAMREVRMLRQLRHPNLIYLIEVFRRKRRLHLVFDYCELTVLDVIEKYGNSCPLNLIKKITWQIVNGINYCHTHNCIHRDVKPENILINQSGVVKLCDFGFARTLNQSNNGRLAIQNNRILSTTGAPNHEKQDLDLDENKENVHSMVHQQSNFHESSRSDRQALTEYVATRWYRAPELLIGEVFYDIKIDIWAIGCVAAELMRGEPIWPGKTDLDQLFIIKSSLGQLTDSQTQTLLSQGIYDQINTERLLEYNFTPSNALDRKLPSRIGDDGVEFVSACLQMDPSKRPTSDELLKHSYIYSSRMSQFMKEQAGISNNYLPNERASLQTNENQEFPKGNLMRRSSKSNSQSLALVVVQDTSVTQRQSSIIQPSSKKLVIANDQRPHQLPIANRVDSSDSKYKRKQPISKNTIIIRTRPPTQSEPRSLVPVARDRTRAVSENSLINKTSQDRIQQTGKFSTMKDRETKVARTKSTKTLDEIHSGTDILNIGRDDERKKVSNKSKINRAINNTNNNHISSGIKFKVNQASLGDNRSNYYGKANVDSSASSTLSDTTSFLPSLFKADDPRKSKYTSSRKVH